MNDFTDIEDELKKLQPRLTSSELLGRIERDLVDLSDKKIIRPDRFRMNWLSLGIGLAAAAVVLLFARLQSDHPSRLQPQVATNSPVPATRSIAPAAFIPEGATQIVYHTRDEGLHFPGGSQEPMRRVRSRTRETLRWHNPTTGASLRVSYPTEQVELIPVSGQ